MPGWPKHRSGFNWWLGSLFIGPLATFLLVVFPPGSSDQPGGYAVTRNQAAIAGGVVVLALLLFVGVALTVNSGSP
jgi:hypothetical protein